MVPTSGNSLKACAGCKASIKTRQFLCCSTCKLNYDLVCASLDEKSFNSMDISKRAQWKCPECRYKQPRSDNTNTPVRGARSPSPVRASQPPAAVKAGQSSSSSSLPLQDKSDNRGAVINDFHKLKLELTEVLKSTIDKCVSQLSAKIDSLTLAFTNFDKRMDIVEERVSTIELRLSEKSCDEPSELANTIRQLKVELNHRDQTFLLNDLEISGLPETSDENPIDIVTLVGSKLGVTIKQRDIVSAMRVGPWREGGDYERPRVLVLRLVRRELRERLLSAARAGRGANTRGFKLPGADDGGVCRFFINERLTKINRQLLFLVRQETKNRQWLRPWTRDGVIFVRRSVNETPKRIRTEDELNQVFCTAPVDVLSVS